MNRRNYRKHPVAFGLLWFLLCVASSHALEELVPLSVPKTVGASDRDLVEAYSDLRRGLELLDLGLHSLAGEKFEALIEGDMTPSAVLARSRIGLFDSFIARGLYDRALVVFYGFESDDSPDYLLRRAILEYVLDRQLDGLEPFSSDRFEKLSIADLDSRYLGWYYFLRSVESDSGGETEKAREFLELAEANASNAEQILFFEKAALRRQLTDEEFDAEGILSDLEKTLGRRRGVPGVASAIENYVSLLGETSGPEEAIRALGDALSRHGSGLTPAEETRLQLLESILLGSDSARGLEILRSIVLAGVDEDSINVALQLLMRGADDPLSLIRFLSEVLEEAASHPLEPRILFLRGQLAVGQSETLSLAEADALKLLSEYPGTPDVGRAYWTLAYTAIRKDPPQYRSAAEYLLRFKDSFAASEATEYVDVAIGDAYFLNEDYSNAADFYQSAFNSEVDQSFRGAVFLRLVTSELRAGAVERAMSFADEVRRGDGVSGADRWKAEWNISQRLLAQGRSSFALSRITRLLESEDFGAVPAVLDIRLRWLDLYLRSLSKDFTNLSVDAEALLRRLDSMPEDIASGVDLPTLRSETMILYADALLGDQEFERAVEVLRKIRSRFPTSEAAERTFLTEASYFASTSDFRAAQTILVALVDNYPKGDLADTALFQAALYAEKRGVEYYRDAILILARLVEAYPGSSIAYEAALRQGDLLRLTNEFASAQLLYDNLINSFPNHPMRYRAELGRADCMVALAEGDHGELADAAVVLERFLDLPNLSPTLRSEASHKWGMTLLKRNSISEAREVFSEIIADFLVDAERASALGSIGRYWLSRSVFALGDLLEDDGEADEARRLYRLMIALDMPGRTISADRLENLSARSLR